MSVEGMSTTINKKDPSYVDATIEQLPGLDDPREVRIIEEMQRQILVTDQAKNTLDSIRENVFENWQASFDHLDDPDFIHQNTQDGARIAAEAANVEIHDGEEHLEGLENGKPVLIVSNHLGIFKLVSLSPDELKDRGVDHKVPSIYYPYLTYYMPFQPIGERLGNNVYEASFEEPLSLGDLFRAAGNVDVPPKEFSGDRVSVLTELSQGLISEHQNPALIVFPEGGTTGKRSGGKIYDLEKFHKGAFVIASKLDIPILPVAQYFDVNRGGIDLSVFKPINVDSNESHEYYDEIADNTRQEMQGWLDSRQASATEAV